MSTVKLIIVFILLNVKKTKELIIDFRKSDNVHENIIIKTEVVERVADYKYLGVFFDDKLETKYSVICLSMWPEIIIINSRSGSRMVIFE